MCSKECVRLKKPWDKWRDNEDDDDDDDEETGCHHVIKYDEKLHDWPETEVHDVRIK